MDIWPDILIGKAMTGKIKYLPLALELMALFVIQTVFDIALCTVLFSSYTSYLFPAKIIFFSKRSLRQVFCFVFFALTFIESVFWYCHNDFIVFVKKKKPLSDKLDKTQRTVQKQKESRQKGILKVSLTSAVIINHSYCLPLEEVDQVQDGPAE